MPIRLAFVNPTKGEVSPTQRSYLVVARAASGRFLPVEKHALADASDSTGIGN